MMTYLCFLFSFLFGVDGKENDHFLRSLDNDERHSGQKSKLLIFYVVLSHIMNHPNYVYARIPYESGLGLHLLAVLFLLYSGHSPR